MAHPVIKASVHSLRSSQKLHVVFPLRIIHRTISLTNNQSCKCCKWIWHHYQKLCRPFAVILPPCNYFLVRSFVRDKLFEDVPVTIFQVAPLPCSLQIRSAQNLAEPNLQ